MFVVLEYGVVEYNSAQGREFKKKREKGKGRKEEGVKKI